MTYVQCLHKNHMENYGTFSWLWGKLLPCFWKHLVWVATTKCSEDNGNMECFICACFRVQQLQVPLVASAPLKHMLSAIQNPEWTNKVLLTSGRVNFGTSSATERVNSIFRVISTWLIFTFSKLPQKLSLFLCHTHKIISNVNLELYKSRNI